MSTESTSSRGLTRQTSWIRPDVVRVRLLGDLDLATAPGVTTYLRHLTADGVRHLVLDLTPVTSMASPGISMLVTALAEAQGVDRVHLVGVANNDHVRRVLDITGVRERFADHDDMDGLLHAPDAGR
ncbi:STAS domain-containing protein [Pseudonocardia broussonetiae]|uniref:Anti-sigma factor antagonist n=1 Tax=Pseudonocardia broussonetiae TaxID=2736640 RepID=A0A6M6JKT0_9PSEU|nr:STAS domain-containing protein [Pseudonocardia broussonetiae]QJY47773.1 STAS domain-containing protein [Pseudonocardia broussonetiae]